MAILNLMSGEKADMNRCISHFLTTIDVRPKSIDTYQKALKQFMFFLDQRNPNHSPVKEDVVAFKQSLSQSGKAAATVSVYLIAVRRFFLWLENGGLYSNITVGIKGAKSPKGFRKDVLSVEQIKKTLEEMPRDTLEGKRNYAMFNVLVRTGIRAIELHRANIEDIREELGEWLLDIQGKGSDSKDEFVLLTEDALRPIQRYLEGRGEKRPYAPLFASHSRRNAGERLSPQSISKAVKRAFRASGIDHRRITAHSLRHTAITFSLIAGASLQEAQTMARHTSMNTTLIYAHNLNRIKEAPERKIDQLLSK